MSNRIVILSISLLSLLGLQSLAQGSDPEQVRQQVINALSGTHSSSAADSAWLAAGAWEALAYVEGDATPAADNLYEAVPDYYNFQGKRLLLKLINPENRNEYGLELKVNYLLSADRIQLLDSQSGELRQEWRILYLDANYLALEMEDLRVFFTHTPLQE